MASASRVSAGSPIIAVVAYICAACSRTVTPSEIEGLWSQSGGNAVPAYVDTRLEFRSDGRLGFVRMPGEYFRPSTTLAVTVSADGRWTLTLEDGDLRVGIQTLAIDGEAANHGLSISVRGGAGDLSLSFPLGDPDGPWVWFEKAQLVRGDSDGVRPALAARSGSPASRAWQPLSRQRR